MCAMDIKLNPSKTADSDRPTQNGAKKSLFNSIQEIKNEVRKISWTTKDELKLSTKIVILSIFVFGFGIYFVDLIIKGFLDLIGMLANVIFR